MDRKTKKNKGDIQENSNDIHQVSTGNACGSILERVDQTSPDTRKGAEKGNGRVASAPLSSGDEARCAALPRTQVESLVGELLRETASNASLGRLPAAVRLHVLAEASARMPAPQPRVFSRWVLGLADAVDAITADVGSGSSSLSGTTADTMPGPSYMVHGELVARHLDDALAKLAAMSIADRRDALNMAVEAATSDGARMPPALICALVSALEKKNAPLINEQFRVVRGEIAALSARLVRADGPPESSAKDFVDASGTMPFLSDMLAIEWSLAKWERMSRAFMLMAKSRGTSHPPSRLLACLMRELTFVAFGEADNLGVALWAARLNRKIFANRLAGGLSDAIREDGQQVFAGQNAEKSPDVAENVGDGAGSGRTPFLGSTTRLLTVTALMVATLCGGFHLYAHGNRYDSLRKETARQTVRVKPGRADFDSSPRS